MAESIVQVTEGSGKKLHTFQRTIGANNVEDEVVILGEHYLPTYTASPGAQSTATAASHLLQVMAGASLNVYIRRITISQLGLATTAAIDELQLFRLTTAGTGGTATTPAPWNTADAASGATAMALPTVKGTEAARILSQGVMFIQTVPTGGPSTAPILADWIFDGVHEESLRIAAGTANGIAIKNPTARAAATVLIVVKFVEANF